MQGTNTDRLSMQTHNGITPLHLAILEGFDDIARILVSVGADPNVCDVDGESPMSMATRHQRETVLARMPQ